MSYSSLRYEDWLCGWREWARTRKRGKMAQFIVDKLEEGNQAQWLNIERGLFELTEWHAIAKEWFGEKPRNSEEVDAPCMLRKGLPRAFPGLDEVKEKSRKEGTQYRSRVFKAPQSLINDVLLHITNNPAAYIQNGGAEHMSFLPSAHVHTYYSNNTSTDNSTSSVSTGSSYFSMNHQLVNSGRGPKPDCNNSSTASSIHGVEIDVRCNDSNNAEYRHQIHRHPHELLNSHDHTATHDYYSQQGTSSYTNDEIDIYVQRITENETNGNSTIVSHPSNSSTNHLYTPPSSVTMLGIPSPPYQLKEEINSPPSGPPPSGPPPYGTSPVSTHSPRISPEPSVLGSYPPSVQQSNATLGSEKSPNNCSSSSPVVQIEPELMKVKVNPSSSPIEGGGQMVLLFYNSLPFGNKMVAFCSQKNHDLAYAQEAFQENMMALICQIPEFPYPEEVELRVYNYNQIFARTTFMFYQRTIQMPPPSDMILQILSSQLQSHFPGGINGMISDSSNSNQMGNGSSGYGYIPNSMYQLLLGACRLGCEPLVHCLLSSPVMEELTVEQIKEAYECAASNCHENLSDLIMELVILHDMTPSAASVSSKYLSRGIGNSQPDHRKHVPAYYSVVDELNQGGDNPEARAEAVLEQLLKAMKSYKQDKDVTDKSIINENLLKQKELANSNQEDVTTPIIEITSNLSVQDLNAPVDKTPSSTRRRLSSSAKLTRQSNSISDEDDESRHAETNLKSSADGYSRESWSEVDDIVPDMVSRKMKHPYNQQSDADSAIDGMSFDEDITNPEAQRRLSSVLLPSDLYASNETISLKLNSNQGQEIANSLEWEAHVVVTEDYPSGQDRKVFCKGDKIVQIGDRSVRSMSEAEFKKKFSSEANTGAIIRLVPAPNSCSGLYQQDIKSLRWTLSEQHATDSVKTKINQLISSKPSSSERRVTIPHSRNGYPIKMIGGKLVGIFVSDADVTQPIFPGDQVLELNGQNTRRLSMHDVNQIVKASKGDLTLLLIENKTKFQSIRELVEIDSIYLRSLIEQKSSTSRDMPLQKGSLLRVVNTCSLPNYWVAWCIDEATGNDIQLKRILPPSIAKKQFGCDAYERLERIDPTFQQPLCITGPNSDEVARFIAETPFFNLCDNMMDVLETCSKGTDHPVMSVTELKKLETIKALHPIIFQTPLDLAPVFDQAKYTCTTEIHINSFLNGDSCIELAKQAISKIQQFKHLSVWKPVGMM